MTAPALSMTTANGRYYYRPNHPEQVPSATNILQQKNKRGIPGWYARTAAEYAVGNWDMLKDLPDAEKTQLIRYSPNQPKEASKVGDLVHDWIDRMVKGESLPSDEINSASITARNTLKSFHAAVAYYEMTFNASEFTVWSDKYGYAGTADLDANVYGMRTLIDTKTGNNVYWETGMQLAALAKADFILDEKGNEHSIPQFDKYAVLHLRPTFFELIPVDNIDACFDGFLGLKASFDTEIAVADKVLSPLARKIKTSTVPVEGD